MAKIGYFEWRGKHGEFSDSFFSLGKAEAACCRHGRNGKGIAQTARQRVEGAEPPEALEIFPFLRESSMLELYKYKSYRNSTNTNH